MHGRIQACLDPLLAAGGFGARLHAGGWAIGFLACGVYTYSIQQTPHTPQTLKGLGLDLRVAGMKPQGFGSGG